MNGEHSNAPASVTTDQRVSDARLAELANHYESADKQHNGWWVAVYWCLRELQERRSAIIETTAVLPTYTEGLPEVDRLLLELNHIASGHGEMLADPEYKRLVPLIVDWAYRQAAAEGRACSSTTKENSFER